MARLLERLTYAYGDSVRGQLPHHTISIERNAYKMTANYRHAATLYRKFREGAGLVIAEERSRNPTARGRVAGRRVWPTWEQPSEEALLALARMVTPLVRFLQPELIFGFSGTFAAAHFSGVPEACDVRFGVPANVWLSMVGCPSGSPGRRLQREARDRSLPPTAKVPENLYSPWSRITSERERYGQPHCTRVESTPLTIFGTDQQRRFQGCGATQARSNSVAFNGIGEWTLNT